MRITTTGSFLSLTNTSTNCFGSAHSRLPEVKSLRTLRELAEELGEASEEALRGQAGRGAENGVLFEDEEPLFYRAMGVAQRQVLGHHNGCGGSV